MTFESEPDRPDMKTIAFDLRATDVAFAEISFHLEAIAIDSKAKAVEAKSIHIESK